MPVTLHVLPLINIGWCPVIKPNVSSLNAVLEQILRPFTGYVISLEVAYEFPIEQAPLLARIPVCFMPAATVQNQSTANAIAGQFQSWRRQFSPLQKKV